MVCPSCEQQLVIDLSSTPSGTRRRNPSGLVRVGREGPVLTGIRGAASADLPPLAARLYQLAEARSTGQPPHVVVNQLVGRHASQAADLVRGAGRRPAPAVREAEPAEQAHPGPRPPQLSAHADRVAPPSAAPDRAVNSPWKPVASHHPTASLRGEGRTVPAPEAALVLPDAQAHAPPGCARRVCQARLRQAGEQCTAETGRSTPAVHDAPHWGQTTLTSACTAWVLARARRIRR